MGNLGILHVIWRFEDMFSLHAKKSQLNMFSREEEKR